MVFEADSFSKGYGTYGVVDGRILEINTKKLNLPIKTRVYLQDGSPDSKPGDRFSFLGAVKTSATDSVLISDGRFVKVSQLGNIALISQKDNMWRHWPAYLSERIARCLAEMLPEEEGGLLAALLTGQKNYSSDFRSQLSMSGTSHITAVSGMHVALLTAFILLLFGKKIGIYLSVPGMIAFAAVTGFQPSVVRAVIMAFLASLAFVLSKEADSLTSLILALNAILCLNPFSVLDLGLQLSFLATLGMILFSPALTQVFCSPVKGQGVINKASRYLLSCAAASFSAIVFTLPVLALHFPRVSIVSALTSVLVLWAVAISMPLGLFVLLLSLISGIFADFIARWALYPVLHYSVAVIGWAARLPFATAGALYLLMIAPFLVGWFIWAGKMPHRLTWAVLAAVFLQTAAFAATSIETHNTSKLNVLPLSDGVSILAANGDKAVAINCGAGSGYLISEQLYRWGLSQLDTVLITGTDVALRSGMDEVNQEIAVAQFIVPKGVCATGYDVECFSNEERGVLQFDEIWAELLPDGTGEHGVLVRSGGVTLMSVCHTQPWGILDSAESADILLVDQSFLDAPHALENLCRLVSPQLLVVADSQFSSQRKPILDWKGKTIYLSNTGMLTVTGRLKYGNK